MSSIPPPPPGGPGGSVPPPPPGSMPGATPPPPPMGAPPPPPMGYQMPAAPAGGGKSGKATAALVLGIAGIPLFFLLGVIPILAIIFGLLARKEIKASGGVLAGKGKATAGLVLGIVMTLATIGLFVAVALDDSVPATDLEEGQCVQLPDLGEDEISSLEEQDCDEPHGGEVYLVERLRGDDFPGNREAERTTQQRCVEEFEDYIGLPYDQSRFEVYYLYPTDETWDRDKEMVCIAFDPDGDIDGTLEDIEE